MSLQLDKIYPLSVGRWGHTVRYNTTITTGASGHESRNANWQDALRSFDAKYSVKTKADVDALIAFFHTVRGRETAFLVKDWMDYKVSGSSIVLFDGDEADGVKTQFQIYKYYDDGVGGVIKRVITYPKSGTVFFAINGTPVPEANYSVNYATGIATFTSAPAADASILATFEFYTPARFATDEFRAEAFHQWVDAGSVEHYRIELPDVPMVEVRGE